MKNLKLLLVCLIFGCSLLYKSQVRKYEYKYDYQIDSTNAASSSTDLMALYISKDGSLFHSISGEKNDSVRNALLDKAYKNTNRNNGNIVLNASGSKMNSQLQDAVRTQITQGKAETYWQRNIGANKFLIKIQRKPIWKLHPETDTYQGYKIQKASTHYGGRDWIVWFTPDIAESEGPFLLKGLPGLVLKAADSKGYHKLELVKMKSVSEMPKESQKSHFGGTTVVATEKQFQKAWKTHLEDPTREFKNFMENNSRSNNGERVVFKSVGTFNNEPIDPKDLEVRLKAQLAKKNNPIDLTVYYGKDTK